MNVYFFFFFSSRRRHTRCGRDWSSDVCSSDLSVGLEHFADQILGKVHVALAHRQHWPQVGRPHRTKQVKHRTLLRSEERRVGKSVDLCGRRIIKKKKKKENINVDDDINEYEVQ